MSIFSNMNVQLKEFINYGFWSIIGTAISKLFLFLIWIFVANVLGTSDYGKFSIIRSTTLLFSEFVGISFSIAATKYIAESLKDAARLRTLIFNLLFLCGILGGFFSFIFWMLSEGIAIHLLKAEDLSVYLSYTSVILCCSTFSNCQLGILRGFGEFKLISKINFIQVVCALPAYYILVKYGGLGGAVWAYVWYNVVIIFITQYYLNKTCLSRNIIVKWRIDLRVLKVLLCYVFPFFLAAFFERVGFWYNETRLVALPETGFVMMGTYSSITILHITIVSVVVLLCQPFISLMAKYKNESAFMIKMNYYLPVLLGMILVIPFLLVPEIYSLFYSKEYIGRDTYVLVILVMAYLPLVLYRHAMSRVVAVYEKQMIQLLDALFMAVIMVIGFICFYRLGVIAMVGSTIVAYIGSIILFTPIYIRTRMIEASLLLNRQVFLIVVVYLSTICLYFLLENYIIIRGVLLLGIYSGVVGCAIKILRRRIYV